MKDFDTERRERHAKREAEMGERTFLLGGETFTFRAASSYTVLGDIGSSEEMSAGDLIAVMEEALVKMLESGQEDRFLSVIRSQEDPLTFSDLTQLVQWLTEAQTERPTIAPSPSTGGDATISTFSTESSSSKPAAVSAA